MSEKSTIFVDIDGVLADFNGAVFLEANNLGKPLPRVELSEFYLADNYQEEEYKDLIAEIYDKEGFARNIPQIQMATEGLLRLCDVGFQPRILSSPLRNKFSKPEKLEWIDANLVPSLEKFILNEAIIDSEKQRYVGSVLIDDKPNIKRTNETKWNHLIFNQPWNSRVPNVPRILGWNDPDLEEKILQSASSKI